MTQEIEDTGSAPRARTIELAGPERGTRIRLSADLLGRLDWWGFATDPPCWGVFRQPGELLCAPKGLTDEHGSHPFEAVLHLASAAPVGSASAWAQIPSGRVITAPDRVIEFSAAWTSDQKQLSLKIGRDTGRQLGWSEDANPPIYANNWGQILLLMSQQRY